MKSNITRRSFIKTIGAGTAFFAFNGLNFNVSSSNKPNILLISADDMGWSDIGCYGSEIETPNIDKLSNGGMHFTQFHNTAKCFPSRACLLTGVYAQDCGYDKTHNNPIQNAVTLGEVLREVGYRTLWSGKHHGKENPFNRGFDHYYGLKDGACNYFNPGIKREGEPAPAHKSSEREWCIDSTMYKPYTPEEKDFYTTDYFTNYALKWLDEYKDEEKPFFLYMAYNAPHDPLMAWPQDIAKYEGKYNEGYEKIRNQRYEKQKSLGLIDEKYILSDSAFTPWHQLNDTKKQEEAQKMEVYAAMIDRLDQNIGRILDKLKDLEKDQNTLILFVSDNGASAEVVNLTTDDDNAKIGSMARWVSLGRNWANVSNTPFRYYKNYSYEGGINTPFIAYWPGEIEPNSFSKFPGHFIDFMATFIDLTKAEYPIEHNGQSIVPYQGQSLLPIFRGENISREKPLYWAWDKGKALLYENWKIVKHGIDSDWDLYNIDEDPTEINDLSEVRPDIIRKLEILYFDWYSKYDDNLTPKNIIDDQNPYLLYTGTWASITVSKCFNKTAVKTRTAGDTIELFFSGTGIKFYTLKGPNLGEFKIYLDGEYKGTVDTSQDSPEFQALVYEIESLDAGESHHIKLEVGNLSKDCYFDYFEIVDGIAVGIHDKSSEPTDFELYQNYPNPFNSSTKIKYALKEPGNVNIDIYNVQGKLVRTLVNEYKKGGKYYATWNAESSASGVYYYRIRIDGILLKVKKMMHLK